MKNVIILGGSGFFGRAFTKYLLDQTNVERICIYSRDEWKQVEMKAETSDPDSRIRYFIGDIRDQDRLTRAMRGVDTVIAAAALKRIEVGNYAPDEMVKTNIIGAMNIIGSAYQAGVKKVVQLSTDKAWGGGVSPYGQSKALAESLYLNANNIYGEAGPKYSVCRYGNIFNSRGSILPTWKKMIAAGATEVPVTDPECTRFFMTIDEAVKLVVDTIVTMRGGELVIPEWLPAFAVGDLATALNVKIRWVGLPAWERKHEGMRDGLTSDIVRRMTVEELRGAIKNV